MKSSLIQSCFKWIKTLFTFSGLRELPIYSNLFSPLKQLRYLNLANCSFEILPLDFFANNTKLSELR